MIAARRAAADRPRRRDRRRAPASAAGRSWASPRSASTATPTASPTRRRRGSAASCTPTARCARCCRGGRRASRSSSTRPASATRFTGYTVGAANSKAYGGGMRAAPDALLDDGLLEVVVLESVSKLRVPDADPAEGLQGHARAAAVRARLPRRARSRSAADRPFTMYADGDPIGELPVRVRALPRRGHDADAPAGRPADPALHRAGPPSAAHRRAAPRALRRGPDGGHARRQARARAGRRRALAPARRRRARARRARS